ncbi:ABC transporter ATP-binding protein [Burkholderia gladioli]|uniref:ABC transporter ATP-binding protein n=1 Tax=Burkholderia gladioli TaxID=28095 RepID=UPI00163E5C42|nr:ABC transporter ATP-binding protein [Burkholderia gladioli]
MPIDQSTPPSHDTPAAPPEPPADGISFSRVVSRLAAMMRGQPLATAFALLCGIGAALLSLTPNVVVYRLVVRLSEGQLDAATMRELMIWLLLGVLLGRLLFLGAVVLSHLLAAGAQAAVRAALVSRLARVPLGFFAGTDSDALKRVVVDDVEQLEDGIAHLIPDFTANFVTPLAVMALLFWVDWRMALAALGALALGIVASLVLMRGNQDVARDFYANQGGLWRAIGEIVRGMPAARLFNQDGHVLGRAGQAVDAYVGTAMRWVDGSLAPSLVMQILVSSPLLLLLPIGVALHQAGSLPLTTLCFFLFFTPGLANLLIKIAGFTNRFVQQQQAIERIDAVLGQTEQPEGDSGTLPAGEIRFRGVSVARGGRRLLEDIDFSMRPGTVTALVGASGSGKSTLAQLLVRAWDVDQGAIEIGGVDLRRLERATLMRAVSCVFQDSFLFNRSVADNIRLGRPEAGEAEVVAAARLAQAHTFIEALPQGYATPLGEAGAGLSGGQRQRIAVARASLKDAPILVLDEATAQLDTHNEAMLQVALSELSRGKTVLVIAHRLASICGADQILVMDQGRIVESGRHQDLLRAGGRYARLWRLQQGEGHGGLDGLNGRNGQNGHDAGAGAGRRGAARIETGAGA